MSHNCPLTHSIIRAGKLHKGCEQCISTKVQQGDTAAFNRRHMQTQFRKDLVQPVDPRNYIKAYGAQGARDYGMSDETIRKYQ